MEDLLLCEATEKDLTPLQIFLPSDIPGFQEEVLSEFKQKTATWILASDNSLLVGHIRIRWGGSRNKYVKSILPNIPTLEALGVKEEFRSQGIGSKLLEEAEKKIKERCYKNSGLVVENKNEKLKQYYFKRGYLDWDKGIFTSEWEEVNDGGSVIKKSEEYTYMLKIL